MKHFLLFVIDSAGQIRARWRAWNRQLGKLLVIEVAFLILIVPYLLFRWLLVDIY